MRSNRPWATRATWIPEPASTDRRGSPHDRVWSTWGLYMGRGSRPDGPNLQVWHATGARFDRLAPETSPATAEHVACARGACHVTAWPGGHCVPRPQRERVPHTLVSRDVSAS